MNRGRAAWTAFLRLAAARIAPFSVRSSTTGCCRISSNINDILMSLPCLRDPSEEKARVAGTDLELIGGVETPRPARSLAGAYPCSFCTLCCNSPISAGVYPFSAGVYPFLGRAPGLRRPLSPPATGEYPSVSSKRRRLPRMRLAPARHLWIRTTVSPLIALSALNLASGQPSSLNDSVQPHLSRQPAI